MQPIYLDHAATTPMAKDVIEEMSRVMSTIYGNPSSVHQFGRQAEFELDSAREVVAKSIHAKPREIVFNGGGSEGDNTVLLGVARQLKEKGNHIITTNIEHSAVKKPLETLMSEGFDVTFLPVDSCGKITVEQLEQALRPETILVSVMYGNNEIGTLNPIKEIGQLLNEKDVLFHTDAVQAFGTELINVDDLLVDYLTVSAHKINGPKGVGFTYIKSNRPTPVLIQGGDQEEKRRAGTENLAGIVGMKTAISLLTPEQKKLNQEKYQLFQNIILKMLEDNDITYEANGDLKNKLPHILNIWFKDVPNNILLSRLDLSGFAISIGSACSAGDVKPSRVIQAIHPENYLAPNESVRISFGINITEENIQDFSTVLITTIQSILKK
ncbi:cysteine desulfurase family protein [Vagococcus sp. JNUCC 83]